jgi:hypothetical protein
MKLKAQQHYVQLGDHKKEVPIIFTLEELKILQGIVIRQIEYLAEEKNEAIKCYDDLALKLEYFITDQES